MVGKTLEDGGGVVVGCLLGTWGGVGDRGDDVEWFGGGGVSRWLAVSAVL